MCPFKRSDKNQEYMGILLSRTRRSDPLKQRFHSTFKSCLCQKKHFLLKLTDTVLLILGHFHPITMNTLEYDDKEETGGQISLHFCGLDGDCLLASDSMSCLCVRFTVYSG